LVDEVVVDDSLEDQVMYGSEVSAIASTRTDCCRSYLSVAVSNALTASSTTVAVIVICELLELVELELDVLDLDSVLEEAELVGWLVASVES
jgi:hypothetical protein